MNFEAREIETTISLSNLKSCLEIQMFRANNFIGDREDIDFVFTQTNLPDLIPVKLIIRPQEVTTVH